jgi:hypothetical protein
MLRLDTRFRSASKKHLNSGVSKALNHACSVTLHYTHWQVHHDFCPAFRGSSRFGELVSTLALQTHDPTNCKKVLADIAGLTLFTYGSHYCSVDNRAGATALACAYFNSGIRVFDIREPSRPKEIAYFNPAGVQSPQAGSIHVMARQWQSGGPDWCTAQIEFDFARRLLITTCQDNGLLLLEF